MEICFNAEIGIFFLENIVFKINDRPIVRYDCIKRNFDYYVKSSRVWLLICLAVLRKKISKRNQDLLNHVIIQICHYEIFIIVLSRLIKDMLWLYLNVVHLRK